MVSFTLLSAQSDCNMENGMMKVMKAMMSNRSTRGELVKLVRGCSRRPRQGVVVVMTVIVIEVELMVIIEVTSILASVIIAVNNIEVSFFVRF